MANAIEDASPQASREVALRPASHKALVADLPDVLSRAREAHENIVGARTRIEYAKAWAQVVRWCVANGFDSLPIQIGTVVLYANWLEAERGYSFSSINLAVAAIKHRHRMAGEMPLKVDQASGELRPTSWKESGLSDWLVGIGRRIADKRSVRQAKALTDLDLREALDLLSPEVHRQALYAAVIVLAYAGCRRRSEVVGLDYMERAAGPLAGTGVLRVDPEGLGITLYTSKTNDGSKPEEYFVRRRDVPRGCTAVEAWLRIGAIAPGTPVFRVIANTGGGASAASGVSHCPANNKPRPWSARQPGGKHIGYFATRALAIAARTAVIGSTPQPSPVQDKRLSGACVSDILKSAMFRILKARRLKETGRKRLRPEEVIELRAEAAKYSGHSARVGAITSAVKRGRRRDEIMRASGHKTSAMVDRYTAKEEAKDINFMEGSGL